MTLVIDIELLSSRYEAAREDPTVGEWPPHPARVFCALVASASCDADWEVLRWLETKGAPQVWAAARTATVRRSGYVVTNTVERRGGSQFHPGRSNGLRTRSAVAIPSGRIRLVWLDARPDRRQLEYLDQMARRVPYLGRSSGLALVSCSAAGVESPAALPEQPELACFEPTVRGTGGQELRVPFPGYADLLADQHRLGRPAWEVASTVSYAAPTTAGDPETRAPVGHVPSVYRDVIIMQFDRFRPDGSLAPLFTEALRRAVMSLTADPVPVALHGHGADGRAHVAFLALPDAGHSHATGRLLGMAVAIPDLPADERRAIVKGVLGAGVADGDGRRFQLNVPHLGEASLTYRPGLVRPWALNPTRWRQGSERWVSVTPVVLDRYPRRGDIETEIARSCLNAGLPEPDDVVMSTAPLVTGGVRLRARDLPDQVRGRIYRHVRLGFPRRVDGPVLVGAGRYLGIGLFAPEIATGREMGVPR